MSERYTRLFSLPKNLYAPNAPVLIAAGALLKDNVTGNIIAQLKIGSIVNKVIKAVKVQIQPLDTIGESLGEPVEYQYLDLNIVRNANFGSKTAIQLPDITTRGFNVSVLNVVYVDNTVWGSIWRRLGAAAGADGAGYIP